MTARDIRRNLLQYLSVIVITMLAVTLFCGFVSNTLTIQKKVNGFFNDCNLTDLLAQFSVLNGDDRGYFGQLSKDKAVDSLEYRFYAEGSVNQKSGKIYAGANAISAPLPAGSESKRGVMVDLKMKELDGYQIGRTIEIEFPGALIAKALNIAVAGDLAVELPITGFMHFAEVANTRSYYPVYIDIDVLSDALQETLPGFSADALYNQVLIKTPKPDTVKDMINGHYRTVENDSLIFIYDRATMESAAALNGEATTSLRMIYVFPVIFLLVSLLVIMTTVSALILRERTNIGTLKALGVSNARIMLHYACFGAALCLTGGILGVIAGPLIVPNVLLIKYNLVYSLPAGWNIVFSPLWSAAAVLTVCLLALLIGVAVCRGVVKEKAAQCMRPAQPKNNIILKRKDDAESRFKGHKGNLPLRMALRNIAIKPSRAIMTVAGVMGCTALLVCSFGIGDTVNNGVDLELGGQFKYDISTAYTAQAAAQGFLGFMDGLKEDGRIEGYETYKVFGMTASGRDTVKAVKVFSVARDSKFTTIKPGGGALMSKSLAEELKVKAGDTVKLTGRENEYDGFKIDGIIETCVTKGIFISAETFDGEYHTMGMWIAAEESAELLELINGNNGTRDAFGMTYRRAEIVRLISSINAIKYTMMMFSVALSAVVLYNLSLLNLKERNRSIATMKVLGFSDREVSSSLFCEIMLLVLPATGLGLLLGFPVLYLVLSINKIEIIAFIYKIKPVSYVLAALLSTAAAAAINLVFGLLIKRVKMIDSLKSVE